MSDAGPVIEHEEARIDEPSWNWAAGVTPAVFAYAAWFAISRYALYLDVVKSDTIMELMYAVMAIVLLAVALAYLRLARSTGLVVGLTILAGGLLSTGLAHGLLEQLEDERRASESWAELFGTEVGSGSSVVRQAAEYAVVFVAVCGPFVASLLIVFLRRRNPAAGSWNWASGAICALTILIVWMASESLATAAAGEGPEMFAKPNYSGRILVTVVLLLAALLMIVAVVCLRVRPVRSFIVGCVLVAGVGATAAPTWHTFHRWAGMEAEAKAAHDDMVERITDEIASGKINESDVPDSLDEPYEEFVRPLEQKAFGLTQDLAPLTIALMALGLARRRASESAGQSMNLVADPLL